MAGSLLTAILGAETLLADSATFRSKVGAANAAQAKLRIGWWEGELPNEFLGQKTLQELRPYAILDVERDGYVQIGQGARLFLGKHGAISLTLQDNPSHPDSSKQSYQDFVDWTSAVADEIAALVGRDTYFPFSGIQLASPPERANLVDRQSDDYYELAWLLTHHIDAGGN